MILVFKTQDGKSKFEIDLDKEGISALIKQILDQADVGELSVMETKYVKGLEKFVEQFKALDLQEIGNFMGLKMGESVHDKILPWMKRQNKLLELYENTYGQMKNLFNKI